MYYDTRNAAHIDQDIQSGGFPCFDYSGGTFDDYVAIFTCQNNIASYIVMTDVVIVIANVIDVIAFNASENGKWAVQCVMKLGCVTFEGIKKRKSVQEHLLGASNYITNANANAPKGLSGQNGI